MASEVLSLCTQIISKISLLYEKARKIDRYWSTIYTLTGSISNASGYTTTVNSCSIRGQFLFVDVTLTPTSAISSGTDRNVKVATLTVTSPSGTTTIADCIPSSAVPLRCDSVFGATGPIGNLTITNFSRTNANTITADIRLGSVYGGNLTTSSGGGVVFWCTVPRLMP